MRANDIVRHEPTGEEWVVCGVNVKYGELVPCGFPFPSIAKISDCTLIEARNLPQDEEQKKALRQHGLYGCIEGRM